MSDYVIRAISADGQIRGFAAITTNVVQELQQRHQTFPVASAALGRTVTMASMMGVTLKGENERLTIQVEGDGPLGKIMVDATGRGTVRGYVDHPSLLIPLKENGKLDVSGAVGQGSIYIIKDLGLKEPYRGTSPIVSGELAEDFTYYFATSEQTPTSVGLGVLVNRDHILVSGGYMVQVMPQASDDVIERLEEKVSAIGGSVTQLLEKGMTPEQLLFDLLGDDAEILEQQSLSFECTCSKERVESMLKSLGKEELIAMLKEDGQAEVVCHFCNEKYMMGSEDLQRFINEF